MLTCWWVPLGTRIYQPLTECDGVRLFPIEQDSRKLDLTSHFCLVSVNCLMTSIVRGSKPRNRISNKYEH
ncbi:Uncharacterized protein APZ42_019937 [Daphnia magna]|uniref:Uncharacterized protein n=1 Tax=Daphnia magna TaxID=35525 RepID=A0A164XUA3_9CRUS|nr:Uncharacterized protein APZ42_019937 [Daphnia magna]